METNKPLASPTLQLWEHYQTPFDYFNQALFENTLPLCMLNFSARGKSFGYFTKDRWCSDKETYTHEISLNPDLLQKPEQQVMATLVRLMVSLWQHTDPQGSPSRAGYFNGQWAEKMEEIGLMPSDTGEAGGAKVGEKIRHYIIEDGKFAESLKQMPKNFFPWRGESLPQLPKRPTRIKYSCPSCGAIVMGSQGLTLKCFTYECDVFFEPESPRPEHHA